MPLLNAPRVHSAGPPGAQAAGPAPELPAAAAPRSAAQTSGSHPVGTAPGALRCPARRRPRCRPHGLPHSPRHPLRPPGHSRGQLHGRPARPQASGRSGAEVPAAGRLCHRDTPPLRRAGPLPGRRRTPQVCTARPGPPRPARPSPALPISGRGGARLLARANPRSGAGPELRLRPRGRAPRPPGPRPRADLSHSGDRLARWTRPWPRR